MIPEALLEADSAAPSRLGSLAGKLAVVVNSSDGFDDCWPPFFELFERFGGALRDAPIYLNTERRCFAWPGLNVQATQSWPPGEAARPSWSGCLRRTLEALPQEYVLYLQEDYFLTATIDSERLAEAVACLDRDPDAGVAYLFRAGPRYRQTRPCSGSFVQIVPPARYLASTQAALWRKDLLLWLLRDWENGWMFEIFGSRRAVRAPWKFLAVDSRIAAQTPIIDYIYTGIIKGRWKPECVALFARHGIAMDFSRRGFYHPRSRLRSRLEVARKLSGSPRNLLRSLLSLLPSTAR